MKHISIICTSNANTRCLKVVLYSYYKDGTRDSQGLNGHGFDDSCPKGHTATWCEGYKDGYSESYYDTNENDS